MADIPGWAARTVRAADYLSMVFPVGCVGPSGFGATNLKDHAYQVCCQVGVVWCWLVAGAVPTWITRIVVALGAKVVTR